MANAEQVHLTIDNQTDSLLTKGSFSTKCGSIVQFENAPAYSVTPNALFAHGSCKTWTGTEGTAEWIMADGAKLTFTFDDPFVGNPVVTFNGNPSFNTRYTASTKGYHADGDVKVTVVISPIK